MVNIYPIERPNLHPKVIIVGVIGEVLVGQAHTAWPSGASICLPVANLCRCSRSNRYCRAPCVSFTALFPLKSPK